MADAYIGEIRMFSGNYAPVGWALCNGQVLLINGNEALYSLIGTMYGGDGRTTFALPDLRGRIPIHKSQQYALGSVGGTERVTLTQAELPAHTHTVRANANQNDAINSSPASGVWGYTSFTSYQTNTASGIVPMDERLVEAIGGSTSHNNMMPSFAINFIIATVGNYPVQQ
ncbi:phage tail protein [Lysinibacillus sp. LZ02]|uniref:phage tail protein n=1 Tax=Lysinibacillus sp. LZ02 TaxID=3420668 RepID=UPI003D3649D4